MESGCLSVCPCVKLCLEDIFRTTELYVTKLGMILHHHNLECRVKRLGSYLQDQDHSAGSNSQKITFSSISLFFFYLLQPNFV